MSLPDFELRAGLDVRCAGRACDEGGGGGTEPLSFAMSILLLTTASTGSSGRKGARFNEATSRGASIDDKFPGSAFFPVSGVSREVPARGDAASSAGVEGVSLTQPPGRCGLVAKAAVGSPARDVGSRGASTAGVCCSETVGAGCAAPSCNAGPAG